MNTAIKFFFWFAFAAFLSATIPHVAYYFRAFEPLGDGYDLLWWGISYAIAISLEVTIYLLSITIAQSRGKTISASVWVFVLVLSGLSWLINWEYAQQFASSMLSKPDQLSILGLSVRDYNPVIASAFAALIIAYTWISDKIGSEQEVKHPVKKREWKLLSTFKHLLSSLVEQTKRLSIFIITSLTDWTPGQKQVKQDVITPEQPAQLHLISAQTDAQDSERFERVKQALSEHPNCSDRELAKHAQMAPATAKKYRAQIEQAS